jgi:signal transduction histidine kinase
VSRLTPRLPWFILALTLLLCIADLFLLALGAGAKDQAAEGLYLVLGFGVVGALVSSRHPRNAVGWICLAIGGLLALPAGEWATYALVTRHGKIPAGEIAGWLDNIVFPACLVLVAFLIGLFPDGRLPSRRWLPAARAAAIGGGLWIFGFAFAPDTLSNSFTWVTNPVGIPLPIGWVPVTLRVFGYFFVLILLLGSAAALIRRLMSADGEVRQQLKWLASAGALLALVYAGSTIATTFGLDLTSGPVGAVAGAAFIVSFLALPATIGIAILKYRLYDIDLVINRSVVFGAMAAFITAVYVAIVVGLGGLLGGGGRPNLALSIVATAIVAVAFQPVRQRVERLANRFVYGKRATPYEVLSQFSHRVAGTYSSEDVLPRMARVLGEGTGASRADVWIRLGEGIAPAASWPAGDALAPPRVAITGQLLPAIPGLSRIVPIRHQGELLGALSINKRPGEALTPIEEKLMTDLAAQAGIVLRSVRLSAELQARLTEISQQAVELRASRQRIVAAQDAERRRLERNIHDGAQQNLVALTVKLRLATSLAKRDPERARVSVRALEADSDQALETLRALARGIYPPLLREQGLAAALRAEAEKMPLPATVRADRLDRYPPDVEAAVYFVCLEALQNVTKHARASRVEISLRSLDHELSFEVTDDGTGFEAAKDARGSGLRNMVDRIEGIGGRLEIRSIAISPPPPAGEGQGGGGRDHGTSVRGAVPIGAMEAMS